MSNRTASVSLTNMNMSNRTASVSLTNPRDVLYVAFGSTAVLLNIFVLIILGKDRQLLKNSSILAGLVSSYLLCGLATLYMGAFRIINVDILNMTVDPWVCIQKIFPLFLVISFETMTSMLLLVGIERLLATAFPHWFKVRWTIKRSWLTVLIAYVYVLIPASVATSIAWFGEPKSSSLSCSPNSVFGVMYLYVYGSTAFSGVAAVVMTLISYRFGVAHLKKLPAVNSERGRFKKEVRLTLAMLTVSCLDFIFVVLPNVLAVIGRVVPSLPTDIGAYKNVLYCVNANLAIVCQLAFNKQFRDATMKLLHIKVNTVSDGMATGLTGQPKVTSRRISNNK